MDSVLNNEDNIMCIRALLTEKLDAYRELQ